MLEPMLLQGPPDQKHIANVILNQQNTHPKPPFYGLIRRKMSTFRAMT
jgi:hypothetical protein